ncbi:MAG: 3'-5' exonuclease domain-containing protein 2 [Bacteroidaceae bacterium]|nr:3'-5' exonuclease domain-containing protein 2 [Bacteroidaceae bacterium]
MRKIYAQIDKRLVDEMPLESFNGRIITVSTMSECDKATAYLQAFEFVGIDTETRPNFSSNESHKVALLQISTDDTCFLFRLNRIGIPDSLAALLANRRQAKIGLSLHDDIRALNQRRHIRIPRIVELQKMVKEVGIIDMSLQKIYANLFGKRISKSKRLTNWEAPTLDEGQKRYAAIDAWACLRIYRQLCRFRTGEEYEYVAPMDDSRMFDIWQDALLKTLQTH